jgi:MoxR-like ATPase
MQERHVTVAGKKMELERPFFVLATQNPIEQEGTYPLPEAQLDRFLFCLNVSYPSAEEELRIFQMPSIEDAPPLQKVLTAAEIIGIQKAVASVPVPQSVAEYAVKLTRATRPEDNDSPAFVKKYLRWGAGPRACQHMGLAAKIFAVIKGRLNVSLEDVKTAAYPVLRHRIITNYNAEADRMSPDNIISELISNLK